MKRYNVDVNLAWSYDHHPSREALDETPSPEGKWVLAEEALPIEAERDELCARVIELEAKVGSLRRRDTGLVVTTNKIIGEFDTVRSKLETERDELCARVAELEAEVERLKASKPATVKSDWKMPVPLQCIHCRIPLSPLATPVSDGEWVLSWDDPCRFCRVPSTSFHFMCDIEWPFVEDSATAADFRALGFVVEVA